ncbi:hypothetical protein VNI00_015318 [Paramarasmius palmivorus]|uniref:DUF7143 domain-containing protein n=1 Tax=Paramarasmius palmivorus TaxID=297713 RepID=A0AAW0BMT2_9AGAR
MFVIPAIFITLLGSAFAAPVARQTQPCFVTGSVALPAEVSKGLAALSSVTCDTSVRQPTLSELIYANLELSIVQREAVPGVPDVTSGGISYSSIDFQKSNLSPVGFALQTFKTPADPASADLNLLQNQLNTYLAVEAGLRSQPNSSGLLGRLKGPKFFLQFQIARVRTALGENLGVADTVEHQLGKVTKNAVGASAAEIAQVNALATQL